MASEQKPMKVKYLTPEEVAARRAALPGGKFPGEQDAAEFEAGWKEYEERRAEWINGL